MKRIALILSFFVLSFFVKGQDKMGFGNMQDGVDSAGVGMVTTWVKKTGPTGGFTMATTSTSSTWRIWAIANSGSIPHWSVTGAVSYEVDGYMPTFDFSTPGAKYITVTSSDELIGVTYLDIFELQLTMLNVSGLSNLQALYCNGNQLTSLNVSGLSSLYIFDCNDNQLTTLDVLGLSSLQGLNCYNNQLTTLDVSGLSSLRGFDCHGNKLTTSAINIMLDQLIAINNGLASYLDARSQVGGGCADPAKIAALDAIWETVLVKACY